MHSGDCNVHDNKSYFSGFYEWKTFKDQTKQPYLIYAKQNSFKSHIVSQDDINKIPRDYLRNQECESLSNNWNENDGWIGRQPMNCNCSY